MQFKELADVKLGLLEDFYLPDVDVVERVNTLTGLLNVFAD